ALTEHLNTEAHQRPVQRWALQAALLGADAQLAQARYELLKLDDPIQSQKQQLNRLLGRDVETPFDVDPASVTNVEPVPLAEAYAAALESRPRLRSVRLHLPKPQPERP